MSKISEGLVFVGDIVGIIPTDIKYYHFKYPNANKIMIIADRESFKITIPSSLVIHERSYSKFIYANHISIDNQGIDNQDIDGTGIGLITFSQLKPDISHEIKISQNYQEKIGMAVVIVYQEP